MRASGDRRRCPVLIGRGDEVATISDAFAAAGGGTGRALVFVGEPGIGKTRLVDELCRAGAYRNVLCLIGRATLESQAVSLRAWTEALTVGCRGRPFPSDAAVSAYRATLAWLVPEWRLDGWFAPIEPSVVIGEAVVRLLGALTAEPAGAGVIAVALEDLHWADDVTIDVLEYVAEHIGTVPAVVVATCRTEGRGPEVVRRVERSGGHVVRLARLSVHNATAMVAACRPPATVTAESASHASSLEANAEIVAASEGLPLVIEDLVAGEESGVASLRFVDSVRSRVERLDHRARRCVSVAAVIGERVDWRVVTRAVTGDARTGGEALRAAIELDLVVVDDELVRFRHALTRRVVLDDLVPDERSRLSRVAAEALVATGGDDPACDELAAELWARAGAVDESIRVLVALSTRAERTGDVSTAERVCARAVELAQARVGGGVGTESEFVVLGAELARLHLLTGRTNDAIALAGQLLARSEGVDRQRTIGLRVLLARANLMRADWNEADSYLVSVRADSLSASVVAEVALLEAECAFGADRPGQRAAIEHQATKAITLAERTGDAELICDAYVLRGRVARLRDLNDAARAFQHALDAAERAARPAARVRVLDELGTVEMLRDARSDRLERAHAEAVRIGAFGAAASTGVNLASAYAMTGHHAQCDQLAAQVGASAERLGIVPLDAACSLLQGIAAAFDDDVGRSEPHLQRAERLGGDDADLRLGVWAIGRGVGALVAGDPERAARAFQRGRELGPRRHARILDAAIGPSLLLRAVAGEPVVDEARAALATEPVGARWSALWIGAAIAASLAHTNPSGGSRELDRALHAGERYPLLGALVRRQIATVAVRTGFSDPTVLLRDAEAAFDSLGLARATAEVRSQLKSLGHAAPRRRSDDRPVAEDLRRAGVSAREAEVLELLADRLTNRQIAQRLFVSAKTIEKHVAALASKLQAGDRHALAELARTCRRR